MQFPLISSYGCCHNCIYCSIPPSNNGKVWFKDSKIIEREIEEIGKKGIKRVRFVDDLFGQNRRKTFDLLQRMKKYSPRGAYCQLRIDNTTERLLDEMKKANFDGIYFGIETPNEQTLKRIGKQYSTEQIKKRIEKVKKLGFNVIGSFTVGYPWEDRKDIKNTLKFAKELKEKQGIKPTTYIVTPYPTTPLYNKTDPSDIVIKDFTKWDAKHAVMDTEKLKAKEIQEIYDSYQQFFKE